MIKKYTNKKKDDQIHEAIVANKKALEKAWRKKEVVYWLDECMFTVKTFMTTDWSPQKMNVTVKSSEFNTQSTAFLGVIAEREGMFYWKSWDRSVNTHKFILFLRQLKKRHGRSRCHIYMDSLPVHKTRKVKSVMEELDMNPIMAPIYSPEYNPIELVFSQMKAIMKRYRLQDMATDRRRSFKELLPKVMRQLKIKNIDNCIQHVYDHYENYFE